MSPILSARSLSKSFWLNGTISPILKDASLDLREGEFLSIIGASGCGKSTFLELLAGVIKPDGGSVVYQDKEITGKGGSLGYMPQDDLLFAWLSVTENALLPARIGKRDVKEAKVRINELLPIFGLEEHRNHLPWQLSGGLRQRTAFLRTYMTNTKVLLLDEPFANLDAITRKQLQIWLKDIAHKLNLSIILVTHDIGEALVLSHRIIVMKGSPGSFVQSYDITQAHKSDTEAMQGLHRELLAALDLEMVQGIQPSI